MIPRTTTLQPPRCRQHHRHGATTRGLRLLRTLCRTLPIFSIRCRLPSSSGTSLLLDPSSTTASGPSASRITGTLFGLSRGRVSLSIQESPCCLPTLVLELALQTQALIREMGSGMVRLALECEKRPEGGGGRGLLEEPLWSLFCNGKRCGYGVRREATEEDLAVMEVLRAVSMGAGVLPVNGEGVGGDGEMAYMRAYFEHAVGNRDSETFYMLSPDGNHGPNLSIFFVRI